MILKEKKSKETMDKNFFKAMNYELAGEIGILDNEDMKKNKCLNSNPKDGEKENKEQEPGRH